jgi:predicted transcriptional regulator
MDTIADKRAVHILRNIASIQSNSDILISRLKLTRKQYYSRTSGLVKAGLVKRQKGRYFLTSFGRVIYSTYTDFETKIEKALNYYWKLKAIDTIESPSKAHLKDIISMLIDSEEIKSILIKEKALDLCSQVPTDTPKDKHDKQGTKTSTFQLQRSQSAH